MGIMIKLGPSDFPVILNKVKDLSHINDVGTPYVRGVRNDKNMRQFTSL